MRHEVCDGGDIDLGGGYDVLFSSTFDFPLFLLFQSGRSI